MLCKLFCLPPAEGSFKLEVEEEGSPAPSKNVDRENRLVSLVMKWQWRKRSQALIRYKLSPRVSYSLHSRVTKWGSAKKILRGTKGVAQNRLCPGLLAHLNPNTFILDLLQNTPR